MGRSRRWTRLFLLGAVLLAGCGNDDDTEDEVTATSTGQPATTAAPTTPEVAQADPTVPIVSETAGLVTVPGVVIATAEGEDNVDRPAPPAGPIPTPEPPIQSHFDSDGDGTYTPEEFVEAITALYPSFAWPERYYQSLDAIITSLESRLQPGMLHQVPGEYTVIGFRHQCAWQMTFLDAFRESDEALMAESLVQLRWSTDNNPLIEPVTVANWHDMYDKAELGDVAQLQQSVSVNCNPGEFTQRPATTPVAAIRPDAG